MSKRSRDVLTLIGLIALTLATGFCAGQVTAPNIAGWYVHLAKPAFNPPDAVFAPVWTILYILMAVAAWRVWRKTGWRSAAMSLWLVQLALNFCWSFIFFGAHALLAALLELGVLWLFVLATLVTFRRADRPAAWLMVPYLAWVSFAGALNYAIWGLNA